MREPFCEKASPKTEEEIRKQIIQEILTLPQFYRAFSVEGRSGDPEGMLVEHGIQQVREGQAGSYLSIKQVLAVLGVDTIRCDNCGDNYDKEGQVKFSEVLWVVLHDTKYAFCCEGCRDNYIKYSSCNGTRGEGCTRTDHYHNYKYKKERKWRLE